MSRVPGESITVLLAEDDAMLRRVVGQILRHAGFEVIEADDGSAGLQVLESERSVDVLLTDVRMPRLNGYQLAEACLTMRPATRVMLMTGYIDEAVPEAIREAAIPVLRKPFDFGDLVRTVRDAAAR